MEYCGNDDCHALPYHAGEKGTLGLTTISFQDVLTTSPVAQTSAAVTDKCNLTVVPSMLLNIQDNEMPGTAD